MLRVALVFSIALWLILVIAAVIIWQVARATGAIGNLESFLGELLADKSFQLDGAQLLRGRRAQRPGAGGRRHRVRGAAGACCST